MLRLAYFLAFIGSITMFVATYVSDLNLSFTIIVVVLFFLSTYLGVRHRANRGGSVDGVLYLDERGDAYAEFLSDPKSKRDHEHLTFIVRKV